MHDLSTTAVEPERLHWDLDQARELYNIAGWSDGYFQIDTQGRVRMTPPGRPEHPGIDMHQLAKSLTAAGLELPVLVRFPAILHDRIDRLGEAFAKAQATVGFRGEYTAVYPIKVNQQRSVIAHILEHGGIRVGLEAGSKAELLAVLGLAPVAGLIICNGYKDAEYIRLALMGRLLGHPIYVVIEKPSELETVIEQARALEIRPLLGIRVRLASLGGGKWQNSGGERAKFGLTAAQALAAVERLQAADCLDDLRLLHFHMGSQIPSIRDIRRGVQEATRLYAALRARGAPLDIFDIGGGLGVDYEGMRSRHYFSINYSLQEYAHSVVHQLGAICDELDLPHPHIISEAGRAMTAHHAVLITQVIDTEFITSAQPLDAPTPTDPAILHELWRLYRDSSGLSLSERYYEVSHWFSEAQVMFAHGLLDLSVRARVEALYFATCQKLVQAMQGRGRYQQEITDELRERLADKYFCNLSIFKSIPDVWGLDQIFPIMPLHRLQERPARHGILHDLTCDSDGQIRQYVNGPGTDSTLPLHDPSPGEPYLLGVFLVGAYQEILGDMHNLFGDTNSVNIELDHTSYRLRDPELGDTAEEVLRYVHFEPKTLMAAYRRKVDQANLPITRARTLLAELQAGLSGYTYLDSS